jgi:hypothetical protein
MALDFPSSPAANELYPSKPPVPGVAYRAMGPDWYDMYGRASPTNLAINGTMLISQINGLTDGTSSGLYMADQFNMYFTSNVGAFRGQRVAVPTPKGTPHRLRVTVNTADPVMDTNESLSLMTAFEGTVMAGLRWGTAYGIPLVIRFGFRGPAGTYGMTLRNNALDRSYVVPVTVTAGQANTDLEFIFIVPPCPDSTWPTDNTRWGTLYWFLSQNAVQTTSFPFQWRPSNQTAPSTITNNVGVAGNVFELFDVGVYADPNWTGMPPEWELPDHTTELRRCQRYWCKIYNSRGTVGTATLAARCAELFPVPMRVVPALTTHGSPLMMDGPNGVAITAIPNNYSSTLNCAFDLTVGAGWSTLYRAASQYYTGNLQDYIAANAKL